MDLLDYQLVYLFPDHKSILWLLVDASPCHVGLVGRTLSRSLAGRAHNMNETRFTSWAIGKH